MNTNIIERFGNQINHLKESIEDDQIKKFKDTIMEDKSKTGMIMDVIDNTSDMKEKNEAMQAAIDNDNMKKLQVLAQRYKEAHTTKVREYQKIGRNDKCPCGSGKKYKNCCMNSGKYENLIDKK